MPDYDDWNTWKEVELYFEQEHIQRQQYSPEDIYELCKGVIADGKRAGLQGCFLRFESTMEPYEDWLGLPSVTCVGYRKKHGRRKSRFSNAGSN